MKLSAGEFVYKENEYASEMYLIIKGTADLLIVYKDLFYPCILFSESYYFGETDLLFSNKKCYLHTVYTLNGCELLTLSRESFEEMLEIFEDEAIKICLIARERYERTIKKIKEALIEIDSRFTVTYHLSLPEKTSINISELKVNSGYSKDLESVVSNASVFSRISSEKATDKEFEDLKRSIESTKTNIRQIKQLSYKMMHSIRK